MNYSKIFLQTSDQSKLCLKIYKENDIDQLKKTPVVLVHGILNSSELFDVPGAEQISLVKTFLDNGFNVYTYDQRGSGESVCENWKFGLAKNAFEDLPRVLNFVLNESSSQKIILGGYSLGGLIIYCFVTYLLKSANDIQGITSNHIDKVFTIASPGFFHKRKGKWKHIFTRNKEKLKEFGPSVDREEFLKGQIYARSRILDKLVTKSTIKMFLKFAQKGILASFVVKSLPIPSFLYRRSDFSSKVFYHIIRSKVLDKTSTQLFLEIFSFATNEGVIELFYREQRIRLPDDFMYWNRFPVLLFSSKKDELVLNEDVECVVNRINREKYFLVDEEIGSGCGHAGYLFKKKTKERVRKKIVEFLIDST